MKLHDVLIPACAGLALLSPLAASASPSDLTLTFSPGAYTENPGTVTTLTFTGTLTDTSATNNIFLNGDQLLLTGTGLTTNDAGYQNLINNTLVDTSNGPDSLYSYLKPGQSVTLGLFTVSLDGTTPLGVYTGNFGVTGGEGEANQNNSNLLVSKPFSVSVQRTGTPPITGFVPETSPVALLGLGLLPLGLLAARRRRA